MWGVFGVDHGWVSASGGAEGRVLAGNEIYNLDIKNISEKLGLGHRDN